MNEESANKEIIVFKESLLQSIVSDIFTFSLFFAMFYLNERFCNGNSWLSFTLVVMFFIMLAGIGIEKNKHFSNGVNNDWKINR